MKKEDKKSNYKYYSIICEEYTEIIEKNVRFLRKYEYGRRILKELRKLGSDIHKWEEKINSAINQINGNVEDWAMSWYYPQRFLIPFGSAIFGDLLIGNLPICFFELRILLESLARCYYIDSKRAQREQFSSFSSLEEEFDKLEEMLGKIKRKNTNKKARGITKTQLMEYVDDKVFKEEKGESPCKNLWKYLSSIGAHPTVKFLKMDTDRRSLIKGLEFPQRYIVIPSPFRKSDLESINKLKEKISIFRKINKKVIEKWIQLLKG
jgi:hypothetical protein